MFDEVLFIEAADNYIFLHTKTKKYIAYMTFRSMEDQMPHDRFIKVHKSFLVASDKITSIEGNIIRIGDKQIPVSRSFKDDLMKRIVNKSLLKR